MRFDANFSPESMGIRFITMAEDEVKEGLTRLFKNVNKDGNTYTKLKSNYKSDKEFNKVLMFRFMEYLKLITEISGDHVFIAISTHLQYAGLDKLLLQIAYREDLDSLSRIKLVKNFNVSLPELIYNEKILYDRLKFMEYNEDYIEIFPEDYIGRDGRKKEYVIGLVAYLNLIRVIKMIKFSLGKSDIAYFDKNNKEKKVFKTYKFIEKSFPYGLIKLFTPDLIDYCYLSKHIEDSNFVDKKDARNELVSEMISSSMDYENNREYIKLLLGSEYTSIITNPMVHKMTNTVEGVIRKGALNKRKVLVPRSGVVLKVEDGSDIDCIMIREIENEFDNNLVIVTRDRSGEEWANSFILSSSFEEDQIYLEKAGLNASSLDYVFDFLGILDKRMIEIRGNGLTRELSYEVISPWYWKYRGLYTDPRDKVDSKGVVIERAYEIDIAHFIRKTKGEAGEDAKKLAKRLSVELEEGQTIVRAHTRQYKRKVLVK